MISSRDPGYPVGTIRSGGSRTLEDRHECVNGHVWYATMRRDLGGYIYLDEREELCPECGRPDGPFDENKEPDDLQA